MKKLAKIIAFILVFVLVFNYFQNIYHQRFDREYINCVKFEKNGDVDVVFIGSSELWVGVVPMVLYQEEGITSFNLGHSNKSSVTYYYEVKYAIKKHHPKVIALDFRSMFSNQTPQNSEDTYRQALYKIPDRKIKYEFIMNMFKIDPEEALSYAFPLLRFHSMWSQENGADFSDEYLYDVIYPDYMLGWYTFNNTLYKETIDEEITPELWQTDISDKPIPSIDKEYYGKIVKLCADENVKLIAVIPPKYNSAKEHASHWDIMIEYFIDNDITYFDYNNYESSQRIGLDWKSDFYNSAHLNYLGAIKWSKYIAQDLKDSLGLPDHRLDSTEYQMQMDQWNSEFSDIYNPLLEEANTME